MKILTVGNYRTPSNAWMRARTLREMGHEIYPVDMSGFSVLQGYKLNGLTAGISRNVFIRQLDYRFLRSMKRFQPEVVYFEKAQWLRPAVIREIRGRLSGKARWLHYNPDEFFGQNSPRRWGSFVEAIPEYDVHFVPKQKNVEDYRLHDAKKVFAIHRSFDPSTHRPIELSPEERQRYGCKIGFVGSCAPWREDVIYQLVQAGYDVKIWGGGWHRGKYWSFLKKQFQGPGCYGEDYAKALCGIDIVLHFLRRENRDLQDSRTYEIPACGRFMLAEWSEDHEALFAESQAAVLFKDVEELRGKLDYYLDRPDERARIAKNGLELMTHGHHRHQDRLSFMLEKGLE